MPTLSGKKVLLGVTAGIAAYKSAFIVRLLIRSGAEVRVVMTPASKDFVTPLTLSTLSKNEVLSSFIDEEDENAQWNNHVELGLWADLMLIAPATANTLSKMANGTCDNLLLAVYLSAKCPVFYAPAMDLDMYKHPSTLDNFERLDRFGNVRIPAVSGELASGLIGPGRMAEPEEIIDFIEQHLKKDLPLTGKRVLVTAGPTYEPIDPVRFIGNHSSGKMGYALAEEAASQGAEVVLVSGPTALKTENGAIRLIKVQTAAEMYQAVHDEFEQCDMVIMSAAVADYTPARVAAEKLKKGNDDLRLELIRTKDILASLGKQKKSQVLVGFAMETQDELNNAKRKLKEKNLDLIVLNSLRDRDAGFQVDTNKVSIIDTDNNVLSFGVKPKRAVARDIINCILDRFYA